MSAQKELSTNESYDEEVNHIKSKRGRPRKYFTEEARRAAIKQQLREFKLRQETKFNEMVKQIEELQLKLKQYDMSS